MLKSLFKKRQQLFTVQMENGDKERILAKNYTELKKILKEKYPESRIKKN